MTNTTNRGERVNNFEEKIKNDLTKKGVDVSPTTITHDLFLRKFVELVGPLERQIEEYLEKLDFTNFDKLTMGDLTKFAGNFFVTVRQGEHADGYVRLFFPNPVDVIVPKGTIFTTAEGDRRYIAQPREETTQTNQRVTADEMINNVSGLYYYADIWVVAEDIGEQYNAEPGEITRCTNQAIAGMVTKIENVVPFRGGTNNETPSSLYYRTKNSLAVRNLANDPSIQTVIKNNFPFVTRIYTVPTGGAEMERDKLIVDLPNSGPTEVRIGNLTDAYIESSLSVTKSVIIFNEEKSVIPFGYGVELDEGPIKDVVFRVLKIEPVDALGEIVGEPFSEWEFRQKEHHENSTRQESEIVILHPDYSFPDNSAPPLFFRVEYIGSDYIAAIQEFVLQEHIRMPVGDILIKGFGLSLLSGDIEYKGDVEVADMIVALRTFFERHEEPSLEISDIIDVMYRAGAKKVRLPISLTISPKDGVDITFDNAYPLETTETFVMHPYHFKISRI